MHKSIPVAMALAGILITEQGLQAKTHGSLSEENANTNTNANQINSSRRPTAEQRFSSADFPAGHKVPHKLSYKVKERDAQEARMIELRAKLQGQDAFNEDPSKMSTLKKRFRNQKTGPRIQDMKAFMLKLIKEQELQLKEGQKNPIKLENVPLSVLKWIPMKIEPKQTLQEMEVKPNFKLAKKRKALEEDLDDLEALADGSLPISYR
mgnify:CR=1 FL=1